MISLQVDHELAAEFVPPGPAAVEQAINDLIDTWEYMEAAGLARVALMNEADPIQQRRYRGLMRFAASRLTA